MLSRSARMAQMTGLSTAPDWTKRGFWVNGQWVRFPMKARIKAYIDQVPEVRFFEGKEGYYPGTMVDMGGGTWSITPLAGVRLKRGGDTVAPPPFDTESKCYSPAMMRALVKDGVLVAAVLDVRYDGKTSVARYDPAPC